MTVFITGVAGFVGANLAASLVARGERVVGFDNLSRGSRRNLQPLLANPAFSFDAIDLADLEAYRRALGEAHARGAITEVWHLAANSDIPAGIADPGVDLRDTFMTTYRHARADEGAANRHACVRFQLGGVRRPRRSPPVRRVWTAVPDLELRRDEARLRRRDQRRARKSPRARVRVPLPERHRDSGHARRDLRFRAQATRHADELDVLGDGSQQKSYLHVEDLVDAMLFICARAPERLACYHIGAEDEGVTVRFIAEQVVAAVAPAAHISYGQGNRGWVGDVPRFAYSVAKLTKLGWRPKLGSAQAVRKAVAQVAEQEAAA